MRCECGSCDSCLKVIHRAIDAAHTVGVATLPFDVESVANTSVDQHGRKLTSKILPLIRAASGGAAPVVPAPLLPALRAWLSQTPSGLHLDGGKLLCPALTTIAMLKNAGPLGIDRTKASPARAADLDALIAEKRAFVLEGTSLVFSREVAPGKSGAGPVFLHAITQ